MKVYELIDLLSQVDDDLDLDFIDIQGYVYDKVIIEVNPDNIVSVSIVYSDDGES